MLQKYNNVTEKLILEDEDGFHRLFEASFISRGPLYSQDEKYRYNLDLVILRKNRLTYGILLML